MTGVYLLQNAVIGSVNEESKILIEGQINSGIEFYCSKDDLTMRGLEEKDLPPQIHLSDYSYLVDWKISGQNIVFSLLILVCLILSALVGIMSVAIAVFFHEASELLAVANGLRMVKELK